MSTRSLQHSRKVGSHTVVCDLISPEHTVVGVPHGELVVDAVYMPAQGMRVAGFQVRILARSEEGEVLGTHDIFLGMSALLGENEANRRKGGK